MLSDLTAGLWGGAGVMATFETRACRCEACGFDFLTPPVLATLARAGCDTSPRNARPARAAVRLLVKLVEDGEVCPRSHFSRPRAHRQWLPWREKWLQGRGADGGARRRGRGQVVAQLARCGAIADLAGLLLPAHRRARAREAARARSDEPPVASPSSEAHDEAPPPARAASSFSARGAPPRLSSAGGRPCPPRPLRPPRPPRPPARSAPRRPRSRPRGAQRAGGRWLKRRGRQGGVRGLGAERPNGSSGAAAVERVAGELFARGIQRLVTRGVYR